MGLPRPVWSAGPVCVDAGVPYFETDDEAEAPVRHRLAEVEPGLFLADNGETLDLRGQVPTWRNLRLVRVSGGPSRWQWAILWGRLDAIEAELEQRPEIPDP